MENEFGVDENHEAMMADRGGEVKGQSNYTDEEGDLILCITRTKDCRVGDCKTCGYKQKFQYETIDGKWWLFGENGKPIRPLRDDEAAEVIWGRTSDG